LERHLQTSRVPFDVTLQRLPSDDGVVVFAIRFMPPNIRNLVLDECGRSRVYRLSIALAAGVPGEVLSPSELLADALVGSEICKQISDSLTRRRTGIQQETLWRIEGSTVQGAHAAVTSQLRISSLTPSHTKSPLFASTCGTR
jgi:hypothetical protein